MRWPAASSTANPTFVITADEGLRGGKKIPLKHNTDLAIEIAERNDVKVDKVLSSSAPPARSSGSRIATSGITRRSPRRSRIARRPR
jgi:acyl-coenzyme A synthetase/AMP-(fatty) acid ligase